MLCTTGPAVPQAPHHVAVKSSASITRSAPMALLAARETAAIMTIVLATEDLIMVSSSNKIGLDPPFVLSGLNRIYDHISIEHVSQHCERVCDRVSEGTRLAARPSIMARSTAVRISKKSPLRMTRLGHFSISIKAGSGPTPVIPGKMCLPFGSRRGWDARATMVQALDNEMGR